MKVIMTQQDYDIIKLVTDNVMNELDPTNPVVQEIVEQFKMDWETFRNENNFSTPKGFVRAGSDSPDTAYIEATHEAMEIIGQMIIPTQLGKLIGAYIQVINMTKTYVGHVKDAQKILQVQ